MLLWFVALIACSASAAHRRAPGVLWALSARTTRCASCRRNPRIAFVALGAVVLCVTGAEALYADMGHFGKRPIRLAWFGARRCRR